MTACWDLEMPSTQKFVLVSLADQANDAGICWPSVSLIQRRTGLGERTIQDAFKWLSDHGALTIKREIGKANTFTVCPSSFIGNPRSSRTPANAAPPQQPHHTPATTAPPPPQQPHPTPAVAAPITINEPSIEPKENPKKRGKRAVVETVPVEQLVLEGVDPSHARDWIAVRKAPLTPTAWDDLKREAFKAGIEPSEAVRICASKGWRGFNAGWMGNLTAKTSKPQSRHTGFESIDYTAGVNPDGTLA